MRTTNRSAVVGRELRIADRSRERLNAVADGRRGLFPLLFLSLGSSLSSRGDQVIFGMALTARTGVLAWNSCILTSRSRDMNILQHDMRFSSDYISQLVGHKSEVCGLKWSTNERELASVGNENQVGGEP
ncbi:hypothetical protein RIF29_26049 [Crotalaria pallida]|uniref:Uncharacterized protein n=1 Tax=Crotalaria pallida TaxID=3830 RepID=A0AAN9EN73_CROPI